MPRTVFVSDERNLAAFLDMIAFSELQPALLEASDDGYNVIVGSRPGKLILFDSYADHPNRLIEWKPGEKSTAAGRYQILYRYWTHYKRALNLPDFSPESQDVYAVRQIREQRAYADVLAGKIEDAIRKCANIWASFPGAGYGQHEHKFEPLIKAFVAAGGEIS